MYIYVYLCIINLYVMFLTIVLPEWLQIVFEILIYLLTYLLGKKNVLSLSALSKVKGLVSKKN